MVAPKGKLNAEPTQDAADNCIRKTVAGRSFKVYKENERVKETRNESIGGNTRSALIPCRMKAAPDKGGFTHLNTKGTLKSLEKSKVFIGTSGKPNTARRALVDISNVHGQQLKNEVRDHLKSVSSIGSSSKKVTASSRKPPTVQGSGNILRGIDVLRASTKVADIKDVKISPTDQKTKGQSGESFGNISRISERKPPLPTRKSLPAQKNSNQLDKSDDKVVKNLDTPEKSKEKHRFPVKAKVATKVPSQVSNARSHLWRNRVSDGFIIMNKKDQAKGDVQALSRNITRPIVRSTCTASNAQKGSKVKGLSTLDSARIGAAVSLRHKSAFAASSTCKKTSSAVSHKLTKEAVKYECGNLSRNTSNINAMEKKPQRRRSYTSLLMARSKLLEEHSGIKKQQELPTIDDKSNQLEVSEYIDDIYQYYWVTETKCPSLGGYMRIQTDITPQIRDILINWLVEVHFKFDLMQETLYLTVSLLDQYLSLVPIKNNEMQLVGLTALLLASKYEDFWHPRGGCGDVTRDVQYMLRGKNKAIETLEDPQLTRFSPIDQIRIYITFLGVIQLHTKTNAFSIHEKKVLKPSRIHYQHWAQFDTTGSWVKDLISISVESYTSDQMLGMEKLILKKLNFRLNVPTLYVFMLRFLKAAHSDTKLENLAFYLIELCLVQYEALKYKPSMLCASAVYIARSTLQICPAWTPLLHKHARYEESEIRGCAEMILRVQKAAKTSKLNVTYEKFLKSDRGRVAAIKPVDRLPF